MQWLQRFLYGRYGSDALNLALLLFGALIAIVFRFTPWWWISFAYIGPVGVALFRMLSRNIEQRRRENEIFLRGLNKLRFWSRFQKQRAKDKTHKYYKCPACGARLRVPRGKGKIRITCPKCAREFVKKT